jgi:hypothetical protein
MVWACAIAEERSWTRSGSCVTRPSFWPGAKHGVGPSHTNIAAAIPSAGFATAYTIYRAHPVSCPTDFWVSSLAEWPGREADHYPPSRLRIPRLFPSSVQFTASASKLRSNQYQDGWWTGKDWEGSGHGLLTTWSSTLLERLPVVQYSRNSNILRNPKVHYRARKSPPLALIWNQINPVQTTQSYLSKIYFNSIHPPTYQPTFLVVSFLLLSPPVTYSFPPFVLYVMPISSFWTCLMAYSKP